MYLVQGVLWEGRDKVGEGKSPPPPKMVLEYSKSQVAPRPLQEHHFLFFLRLLGALPLLIEPSGEFPTPWNTISPRVHLVPSKRPQQESRRGGAV